MAISQPCLSLPVIGVLEEWERAGGIPDGRSRLGIDRKPRICCHPKPINPLFSSSPQPRVEVKSGAGIPSTARGQHPPIQSRLSQGGLGRGLSTPYRALYFGEIV